MKTFKVTAIFLALTLLLSFTACKKESTENEASSVAAYLNYESEIDILPHTSVTDIKVSLAATRSAGAGTVVEKLSLTPLTESPSYTVRDAVNYKWIAYDNYTFRVQYEEPTQLAEGGYLLYVELPKTSFDHEMYFELFASSDKVAEYSGEVAYTESDKTWYSLPLGASNWTEHTTQKYKLCFDDGGEEFKGYIFIPSDSFTYRYEADTLSDVCIYVKTGVETGNGDTGKGITFTVSTFLPVSSFDKTTTIAISGFNTVDLSKNIADE